MARKITTFRPDSYTSSGGGRTWQAKVQRKDLPLPQPIASWPASGEISVLRFDSDGRRLPSEKR